MFSVVVSPARAIIAKAAASLPPQPPVSPTTPHPSARVVRKADLVKGHQIVSEYQFGTEPTSIERDDLFMLHACNKAPVDMKMRLFRDILEDAGTSVVALRAPRSFPHDAPDRFGVMPFKVEEVDSSTVTIPVGSSRMFLVDIGIKAVVRVLASSTLSLTFYKK